MKAKVSAHVVGVFVSLLFAIPVHAQTSEPACVIVVTPPTIAVGGSVTLRWDSTSTASGIISHIGAVPVRGSVTLTPSSGGKTTFAGTFFGPNGTTTCDASVTVGSSGSSGYTQSSYTQSTYGTGDVPDMTSYGTGDAPPNATGYSIGNKVPDATGYSIDQNSFKTQPNIGNFTNPAPGVTTGAAPPNNSTKGSLVPCGFEKSPSNPTSGTITPYNASATSCDVCSFAQLIQNLINFMLMLAIPIAAGLFAYAGILRFTSMGDTGKITKSSKIFLSVFVGFAIALSGYLIVQTLLNAFLAGGWSWTKLECTGNRERGSSIQEIFKGVLTTGQVGLTPSGTQTGGTGNGNGTGVVTQTGKGDCSPEALSSSLGGLSSQQVQTFSCIVSNESGCVPNNPSWIDKTADGYSFSMGLYQTNLVNTNFNNDACVSAARAAGYQGTTLNCGSAFTPPSDPNARMNVKGLNVRAGSGYGYTIKDKSLYDVCMAAASNVQCNTAAAKGLYDANLKASGNGFAAWGNKTNSQKCGIANTYGNL